MTTMALDRPISIAGKRLREVIAGSTGNVLDSYDFSVYAFFVPTISIVFFPAKTEIMSILIAFAAFGAGFVTRPLGAVVFGIYGDRAGRRASLALVSIIMGIATVAIGLMPSYDSIGIWAAVGIVIARLVQGLAVGGEYGGAIPYLVEVAPRRLRGFTGSFQQCGNAVGLLMGSLSAFVLTASLSPEDMKSWGWRIPFLAGILPAFVGWYLRTKLSETPVFERLEAQHAKSSSPARAAFTTHFNELALSFGLVVHLSAGIYIVGIFMPTYLGLVSKIDRSQALLVVSAGLLTYGIVCPLAGLLSDRLGRKTMMLLSSGGSVLFTYPLFAMVRSGDFEAAVLAEIVLAALLGLSGGPISAVLAEASSAKIRSTVVAISVAFGITIFGGFAPFIGTYLISTFGSPLAPAFYGIAAAAVTCVAAMMMRETAFDETI